MWWLVAAAAALSCPASTVPVTAAASNATTLVVTAGDIVIDVSLQKFGISVYDTTGEQRRLILRTSPSGVTFGKFDGVYEPFYEGYLFREGIGLNLGSATKCTNWKISDSVVTLQLATTSSSHTINATLCGFQRRRFSLNMAVLPSSTVHVMPTDFSVPTVSAAFESDPGEGFFGFGQRWQGDNQRGNKISCWTEDGAWSFLEKPNDTATDFPVKDATYMPSPFLYSSHGHGVLLDVSARSTFDLAKSERNVWRFEVESNEASVVFLLGVTPSDTLAQFIDWRGGPTLIPPPYEFAPWKQLGSTIPGKDDMTVALRMIADDIPFSLVQGYVHFFPRGGQVNHTDELAAQNAAFHALGLASTCYFNPYVATDYQPLYDQAADAKYFTLKVTESKPFTFRYMNFYAAQVDFTNAAATKWYQDQMATALDMGFDGWMYDFAEYTPIDSVAFTGELGVNLHNRYPVLYQKAVYDLFTSPRYNPNPRSGYAPPYVAFHRSGYTQTGLYMWAHWTGDPSADWSVASGLPAQIAGCLSSGLMGVPFCGSDMGGYVCQLRPKGSPSAELLARWVQYGVFAGIMRDETQGSSCVDRAQLYTNNITFTVWRKFAKLRTQLFPYIYTAAHTAATSGLPITRHHLLSFPNDAVALNQSYQYMFGPSFLVAPIVIEGASSQNVYLPVGESWIDVGSRLMFDIPDGRFRIGYSAAQPGGQHVSVSVPLDCAPLFVRAGSIIALLDPSVDTVNEKKGSGAVANSVVPMSARANITHVWVFPGSGRSAAATYDGDAFTLTPSASSLVLNITRGARGDRTFVVQVATGSSPAGVTTVGGDNVPRAPSWRTLTNVTTVGPPAWAWDAEQGTAWVRVPRGVSGVRLAL